ncbi:uncharacterized protein [Epargyreus clarus]|uniref:uncharacterized protein n=1 Tax=Epargyreus clarus TaxID=520877 RepID=UPI003C2DCB27
MKVFLFVLACAAWEASAYPYPYYGANMDTFSYGSADRGMVMSRYYNPYYSNPRSVGAGMAAFMFRPEDQYQPSSQYYSPDRRRQTTQENYIPPQQNEVYYPQIPDQLPEQQPERAEQPELSPATGTLPTELADPTEKTEIATVKATAVPEIVEPEVEEVQEPQPPKKRVTKKKQVKRPEEEEEAVEEEHAPKIPTGAYFPMFFGWGGRSGGAPGGATAIANAFSTGRGGVATSHATAYGPPRPEAKL